MSYNSKYDAERYHVDGISTSHSEGITCITTIKDCIATGALDSTIKIWDSHTFKLIKTLRGHKLWVTCL